MAQTTIISEQLEAAVAETASHQPMTAIDSGSLRGAARVWIYCSCGFNRDGLLLDPQDWTSHLTPATILAPLERREQQLRLEARIEEQNEHACCDFIMGGPHAPYCNKCNRLTALRAELAKVKSIDSNPKQ